MKVLKYANTHKPKLVIAVLLIFVSVIMEVAPFFVIKDLLIEVLAGHQVLMSQFFYWAGLIVLFFVVRSISYIMGLTLSHHAAYGILYEMRKQFSEKLERMPLGAVKSKGAGYYKKKIVDDIGALEVNFAHMFVEGIPNLIVPIIVLILIFATDWRLGLLSLASIPIPMVAMSHMMKAGMSKMDGYYKAQNQLNSTVIEYISGIEVIKIFGRLSSSYKKYTDHVENYKEYSLDWCKSSWGVMAIIGVLLPATMILTMPVGALMVSHNALDMETYIFVLLLNLSMGVPILSFTIFLPHIPITNYAVEELEQVFLGKDLQWGELEEAPLKKDIQLENVVFGYEETEVIKEMNLNIKEESLTAIVGPSGGGKSTIAKLLVHYYDVKSGTIKIGGKDLTSFSQECLMSMISYVSQDNFLFDDTIMENIRIGNRNASDEQVMEAAKAASCHDFIIGLENGYETHVGKFGDKLSGGEKQRITIARAILKDSPILILDEATAFTDVENEDVIQEALSNLMKEKTVIIIAHRLRTIIGADQIIVVDQGEVVGTGTHQELLKTTPLYEELWDANERAFHWELEVK